MPPTSQPRPPAAAKLSNTNRTSSGSSRSAFISRGMAVTIIPTMVESDTSPDAGEGLPAAPLNRGRDPQFRRGFNPATWYTVLGIVLLAATFWIPITTANRTARVEGRADALAEVLLLEAMASAPLDFQDPATAAMIYGRLVRRAATQNIYVDDLELLPAQPDTPAITLRNKHYVVQLRPSPQGRTGRGVRRMCPRTATPRHRSRLPALAPARSRRTSFVRWCSATPQLVGQCFPWRPWSRQEQTQCW